MAPLAAAPEAAAALAPPSAFAWGDNEFGQVGNGSKATVEFDSPLSVTLPAAVKQVAASPDEFASAAVLATGKVEVQATHGEASTDAPNPSLSPQLISGLTGIIQVAVGGGHVLAPGLRRHRLVVSNNTYGQLGNGTTVRPSTQLTPVPVPGINGTSRSPLAAALASRCAVTARPMPGA